MLEHHGQNSISDPDQNLRFTCIFTSGMQEHSGNKLHICVFCGKSFTRKGHLTQHMLIHSQDKLHNSGTCGKSFTRKSHLTEHIFIRTWYKPHICGICGNCQNNLPRKSTLKRTREISHTNLEFSH